MHSNYPFVSVFILAAVLLAAGCEHKEPAINASAPSTKQPSEAPQSISAADGQAGIIAPTNPLTVYKSPTCGCCGAWIEHMEDQGFATRIEEPEDLNAVKNRFGLTPPLQSCHTAVSAEGFVFEGHVPARYIAAFLTEPPQDAIGLTVPGMPLGSPGMEVDDRFTPYQVLLLKADGSTAVYAAVNSPADQ